VLGRTKSFRASAPEVPALPTESASLSGRTFLSRTTLTKSARLRAFGFLSDQGERGGKQ